MVGQTEIDEDRWTNGQRQTKTLEGQTDLQVHGEMDKQPREENKIGLMDEYMDRHEAKQMDEWMEG